jgi:hypothetical protein
VSVPAHAELGDECFTRGAYARMLDVALASGYVFVPYHDPRPVGRERLCLLRHDIDVDPAKAVELARIENGLGIRSTYFVMVRSAMYNPFGRANQTLLREIAELGHWIGLHYDVAFVPPGRTATEWIGIEADVLATMLGVKVRSVSFHQPMLSELRPSDLRQQQLVSAFDFPGFTYVSDANRQLREGSFIRLFRQATYERLQLCIHPVWWATDDPDATPLELWDAAIVSNFNRSQEQMLATERAYGPARIVSLTHADAPVYRR